MGKPGILIIQGSTLKVSGLGFTIDRTTGAVTAKPVTPTAQVDFWPHWLRVAVDHLPAVHSAREHLLAQTEGAAEARALEVEIRAAMTVLGAAAFSVEAFTTAVQHHSGIGRDVGQNTSTPRRIAEILRRAFIMGPESFRGMRDVLIKLFRVRNLAVHPPADFQAFRPHPVTAAVPVPFAWFTYENSESVLQFVFDMLVWCTASPRPASSVEFRDWCERQQQWVEPLLDAWTTATNHGKGFENPATV